MALNTSQAVLKKFIREDGTIMHDRLNEATERSTIQDRALMSSIIDIKTWVVWLFDSEEWEVDTWNAGWVVAEWNSANTPTVLLKMPWNSITLENIYEELSLTEASLKKVWTDVLKQWELKVKTAIEVSNKAERKLNLVLMDSINCAFLDTSITTSPITWHKLHRLEDWVSTISAFKPLAEGILDSSWNQKTQSNVLVESPKLTEDALDQAQRQRATMRNHFDRKNQKPSSSVILVTDYGEVNARKILGTEKALWSNNNDINLNFWRVYYAPTDFQPLVREFDSNGDATWNYVEWYEAFMIIDSWADSRKMFRAAIDVDGLTTYEVNERTNNTNSVKQTTYRSSVYAGSWVRWAFEVIASDGTNVAYDY